MVRLSSDRLLHVVAVAEKMKEIVLSNNPANTHFADEMYLLGYLHDIGYALCEDPSEHARVGGDFLRQSNYPYWKEVYHHGRIAEYHSEALNLLNTADLLVAPNGVSVSCKERLFDVKMRHGKDSEAYQSFCELARYLGLIE